MIEGKAPRRRASTEGLTVNQKEKPCDSCGARNPSKNGHWFGCKKGKKK